MPSRRPDNSDRVSTRTPLSGTHGRARILFLAQRPPPLHGQSAIAERVYQFFHESEEVEVTHLWSGGAASRKDVGRRRIGKFVGVFMLLFSLLWKIASRERYDITYLGFAPWAHTVWRDAILVFLAGRLANRVWLHVHGDGLWHALSGPGLSRRLLRRLFRDAEILAVATPTARDARMLGLFAAVHDLPNCADGLEFTVQRADGPVRLACLGHLDPRKGVLTFVDAVAAMKSRGLAVRAVIAGDTTAQLSIRQLRDYVATRGVADCIKAIGAVDEADRDSLLVEADILVHLSRHDLAPLSVIEAMAAGCAPIVCDTGGIRDMLGPSLSHCVIDPTIPGAAMAHCVAAMMEGYFRDPRLLVLDQRSALFRYQERFTPEHFDHRLSALLHRPAQRRARSASVRQGVAVP